MYINNSNFTENLSGAAGGALYLGFNNNVILLNTVIEYNVGS